MEKKRDSEELARLCVFFSEHAEKGDDGGLLVRRPGPAAKQQGFSGQATMTLKDKGVLSRYRDELWRFDPTQLPEATLKAFERLRAGAESVQTDNPVIDDEPDADGPDPLEVLAFEPPDTEDDEEVPPEDVLQEIMQAQGHPHQKDEGGPHLDLRVPALEKRIRELDALLGTIQKERDGFREKNERLRLSLEEWYGEVQRLAEENKALREREISEEVNAALKKEVETLTQQKQNLQRQVASLELRIKVMAAYLATNGDKKAVERLFAIANSVKYGKKSEF